MEGSKYKMAVEFLIGQVEDFIDGALPEYNLDSEFRNEIRELKRRIEVVRKFENEEV